ncbi:transcription/translation regulatory transformer protein RfaH [Vibrio cincinnatiensis]|jgi:transcriptional antiterminator RfaH|uniref:transcription/translation regulatory transformer protein RfaH n=1 Tax=Vibrio cincinnatiensis TaxID=675 RepID=UPI0012AD16E5|nr:transcription/translation regulatory transformer protein RfaH [Vibrio cincinnatiensis]MCG3726434.1 transcription/translation regulatory transformer protein RfaH [Vibrio cincinnatiensis]MCG3731821.1 transcription/translation regulatory transformer protein RfaH [Vibrio cincinnatiensis]MCG3739517.1 transcription/translation regulatory transformer protein RfaH [Vibrio cincinnatiensis]MCG3742110.1 transcription/translation regulatory transformer protein RfaH [Vibrio cincinnatiensis]MCG3766694.1 
MKCWYLVYCKRGEQARAKGHLENQGVECFYPQIEVEKIIRGKRKTITEPLFPSYIFVYFDYQQGPTFTTIRSTRGVVDFVRFGPEPKALPDELVDELKQLDVLAKAYCKKELPLAGQEIEVKSGQFCGIKAIYQEPDGDTRSFMLVKMINQPVILSIDNKHLELKSR